MLFGLLFSVIGLAIAVFFLPFRILNSVLGLALLPVRIIVKLLTRNLFVVALLVIGVLIYRAIDSGSSSLPEVTPAAAPVATAQQGAGKPVVVEPVLKKEDGDSNFATDLYAAMNEQERATYSYNYYLAMNSIADGQVHSWTGGNIAGSLRPESTFTNNTGGRCRKFSEVLKVHTVQQTLTGTACEQGNGAWCKLRPNATPACNLGGYKPGILDSLFNMF